MIVNAQGNGNGVRLRPWRLIGVIICCAAIFLVATTMYSAHRIPKSVAAFHFFGTILVLGWIDNHRALIWDTNGTFVLDIDKRTRTNIVTPKSWHQAFDAVIAVSPDGQTVGGLDAAGNQWTVSTSSVLRGQARNSATINALKQFIWFPDGNRSSIFEDHITNPNKPNPYYLYSGHGPRTLIKVGQMASPWQAVGAMSNGQILIVDDYDVSTRGPYLAAANPSTGNVTPLNASWPPRKAQWSANGSNMIPDFALSPQGDRLACTIMTEYSRPLALAGLKPPQPYSLYVGDTSGNHWQLAATFDRLPDNPRWLPDGKHLSVRLISGSFEKGTAQYDLAVVAITRD